MALTAYRFRRTSNFRPKAKPKATPKARWTPPPAYLISAVLEHADLRDDMGGGKVMMRLSPALFASLGLASELGEGSERVCDIAVIYDEREDEIIRVLDGSGAGPRLVAPPVLPDERDTFVMTPEAEAYLANHTLAEND